jgi:hypothetical protein
MSFYGELVRNDDLGDSAMTEMRRWVEDDVKFW